MAISRTHFYSSERSNEFVRRVKILPDEDVFTATDNYYIVRVGVRKSTGGRDYIGEWSGAKYPLTEGQPFVLTGGGDLNWPLNIDDVCFVEVEEIGADPPGLPSLQVEWKFARYGEIQELAIPRVDGSTANAREVSKPLFSSSARMDSIRNQFAIDELTNLLNDSGITEWVESISP